MSKVFYCRRCGTKLLNQPGAPCPRCLLGVAMQADPAPGEPLEPAAAPAPGQPAAAMDVAATVASPPPVQAGDSELPTAAELAPYFPQLEILELLGRGGMGAVYKARQRGLDRLVAVKILPPSAGQAPGFAERFTREARALARLSHPGIVAVYDFGHIQGLYYFIMEYVDGADLRRLIRSGRMKPKEALAIVPQICDALQYAHDAGVIHRDIKPENILMDAKGRVKIADFGLAKLFGPATPDYTLTAAECSMGTPRYMAPEQMDNPKSVDHRADIYSLGVVFYEMLTGEVPAGRFAVPSQKSAADVRLDAVVLRSLEREPGLRYQKASDVKTAVETACSARRMPPPLPPQPPPMPQMGSPARRRSGKRALAVIAALLCVFVLPFLLYSFFAHHEEASYDSKQATAYVTAPMMKEETKQETRNDAGSLMRAVEQSNSQEIQTLLGNGANVNERDLSTGDTPLTKAAALGLQGPATVLLTFSADPDGRSTAGATPLALAAANGHADLVELLIHRRAQVNARGNSRGQTALSLAASNGHTKAVEFLLANGADPNLRDDEDLTPIVYAEAHGWPEAAAYLRSHALTDDPNCAFTEAYMNVLDGKPADAIPQIEKLLKLGIQEYQRPWHIVSKDWVYTVPRPRIVLSLVLAECYKRTDQAPKAQAILAETYANFGTDTVLIYRRGTQPDKNAKAVESYYLGSDNLKKWSNDVSIQPEVGLIAAKEIDGPPTLQGSVTGIIH